MDCWRHALLIIVPSFVIFVNFARASRPTSLSGIMRKDLGWTAGACFHAPVALLPERSLQPDIHRNNLADVQLRVLVIIQGPAHGLISSGIGALDSLDFGRRHLMQCPWSPDFAPL